MPTAQLIRDPSLGPAPRLWTTKDGDRGERSYLVDAADPDEALTADGLPKVGDSWNAQRPALIVLEASPQYLAGTPDFSVVIVQYAELRGPSGSGVIGDGFTRFRTIWNYRSVYVDLDTGENLNGRYGAPQMVPLLEAEVTRYEPRSWEGLPAVLAARGKLNSHAVVLPEILGANRHWTMDRGQVLYLGVDEPEVQGQALRVVHRMWLDVDFRYEWMPVDQDGHAKLDPNTQEPIVKLGRIYRFADLRGLW